MLKVYRVKIFFSFTHPKRVFCTLSLMSTIMDGPLTHSGIIYFWESM